MVLVTFNLALLLLNIDYISQYESTNHLYPRTPFWQHRHHCRRRSRRSVSFPSIRQKRKENSRFCTSRPQPEDGYGTLLVRNMTPAEATAPSTSTTKPPIVDRVLRTGGWGKEAAKFIAWGPMGYAALRGYAGWTGKDKPPQNPSAGGKN